MIPQEVISKWQNLWRMICDMAYDGVSFRDSFIMSGTIDELYELNEYSKQFPDEFEQLTLDYTWKQYSNKRGDEGKYKDVRVFLELNEIFVPRILFESLGVLQWFKHSFPYCVIRFWEYNM